MQYTNYGGKQMTYANTRQVGGTHYQQHGAIQHWDFAGHFNMDYFQGQITKYVMRWRDKGGIQDLEKARHFLDKYIELEKQKREDAEVKAQLAQRAMAGTPQGGGAQLQNGPSPLTGAAPMVPTPSREFKA
jgi:hypothetical protein